MNEIVNKILIMICGIIGAILSRDVWGLVGGLFVGWLFFGESNEN